MRSINFMKSDILNLSIPNQKVFSRDRRHIGRTTGSTRQCRLEGCPGTRIGVRWSDGRITWPCSNGLKYVFLALKII